MTQTLGFEAFEHFVLADDRDERPMTFFFQLRFRGVIEEQKLRSAITIALRYHPLLRALSVGHADGPIGQLSWRILDEVDIHLDCAPMGEDWRYPQGSERLDLAQEPGLRLFMRQGDQSALLLAQFHHASTDALGALRFLEDLMVAYAQLEGDNITSRPLDAGLLAGRGEFHLSKDDKRRRLGKDLKRIALFFRNFPEPLVVPRPELAQQTASQGYFPSYLAAKLTSKELADLHNGSRAVGATVNDVLLTELFRTLDAWNSNAGRRSGIRLAMPINMRRPGSSDERLPACNVVSMCFLDRSPALLSASPERLLKSVVQETRDIKSHYMGYALIYIAQRFARLKGGMKQLVTPRFPWRCHATAVLSNVGHVFTNTPLTRLADGRLAMGALTLEEVNFMPPVRDDTRVAFGAASYNRSLSIALHYERRLLEPMVAQDLLTRYVASLRDSIVSEQQVHEIFQRRLDRIAEQRTTRPLRSLPIGKNVAPQASDSAPVLVAAQPQEETR